MERLKLWPSSHSTYYSYVMTFGESPRGKLGKVHGIEKAFSETDPMFYMDIGRSKNTLVVSGEFNDGEEDLVRKLKGRLARLKPELLAQPTVYVLKVLPKHLLLLSREELMLYELFKREGKRRSVGTYEVDFGDWHIAIRGTAVEIGNGVSQTTVMPLSSIKNLTLGVMALDHKYTHLAGQPLGYGSG